MNKILNTKYQHQGMLYSKETFKSCVHSFPSLANQRDFIDTSQQTLGVPFFPLIPPSEKRVHTQKNQQYSSKACPRKEEIPLFLQALYPNSHK
jgi:hypothetical protein